MAKTSPDKLLKNRNVDQKIIDSFWSLSDSSVEKRAESADTILNILKKDKETNNICGLTYCFDRLVRGMGSSRKCARQGFGVLLTELLRVYGDEKSLAQVLELAETHLGKTNENLSHESVIGWTLIAAAIVESGQMMIDQKIFNKIIEVLFVLGIKKDYVEPIICELIRDIVTRYKSHAKLFHKYLIPMFESYLNQQEECGSFLLFIYLVLLQNYPEVETKSEKTRNLLQKKNYPKLIKLIQGTTKSHPRVHPINLELIKVIIQRKDFENFWTMTYQEALFQPGQMERIFLGFELIKFCLPLVEEEGNIEALVSSSFLKIFMQLISNQKNSLHQAAHGLANFFMDFIKNCDNTKKQFVMANCFIQPPGSLFFDEVTKTKFLSLMISNFNYEAAKEWVKKLKIIFNSTDKIINNDSLRVSCIMQMTSIIKCQSVREDMDWLHQLVKFFFVHSYFEIKTNKNLSKEGFKSTAVSLTDRLRQVCRDSFRKSITFISRVGSKTTRERFKQETESLLKMIKFADMLLNLKGVSCLVKTEQFLLNWTRIGDQLKHLSQFQSSKKLNKENEIRIFQLLYSIIALNLFEEPDISSSLDDLDECMKRALGDGKDDDTLVWADVILDLMLSLLTSDLKLNRIFLVSSFDYVCPYITEVGLKQLLNGISAKSEDLSDEELDDDYENEDLNEVDNDNNEEDSESVDSGSTDDLEDDYEVDEKFRNDVKTALGTAAQLEEEEEADEDKQSIMLSDDEMYQFDQALAEVFRNKLRNKAEIKQKEEKLLHFRMRCFDLLEVFLNQNQPDLSLVVQLVEPLTKIAKNTHNVSKQNQMAFKSIKLMRKISKTRQFSDKNETVKLSQLKLINNELFEVLKRISSGDFQKAILELNCWIIILSKRYFPDDVWYSRRYKSLLKEFFEKSNFHISLNFFISSLEKLQEFAQDFFEVIIEYAFSDTLRNYRKTNAVKLLLVVLKILSQKSNEEFQGLFKDVCTKTLALMKNSLLDEKSRHFNALLIELLALELSYIKSTSTSSLIEEFSTELQHVIEKLRDLPKRMRKGFKKSTRVALNKIISS